MSETDVHTGGPMKARAVGRCGPRTNTAARRSRRRSAKSSSWG